jgi:hypothetical protein
MRQSRTKLGERREVRGGVSNNAGDDAAHPSQEKEIRRAPTPTDGHGPSPTDGHTNKQRTMGWVKLTAKIADVPPSAIDWNSPAFLVSLMVQKRDPFFRILDDSRQCEEEAATPVRSKGQAPRRDGRKIRGGRRKGKMRKGKFASCVDEGRPSVRRTGVISMVQGVPRIYGHESGRKILSKIH